MSAKFNRPIKLKESPKEKEYEEFIASIFQSSGYYIERNIIKREKKEILELDIILTNYSREVPEITLLEAKSGDWGFEAIFKIRGWMDYLNIRDGYLIIKKEKDNIDEYRKVANALNIGLSVISDLNKAEHELSGIMINREIDEKDSHALRYSCWMERNLIRKLIHKCKSEKDKLCFQALRDYYYHINNTIFFQENIINRIVSLYQYYAKYPNISAMTSNELSGKSFDGNVENINPELYKDTFINCSLTDIQISTLIEHRARLAIFKNSIDYKLFYQVGNKKKTSDNKLLLGKSKQEISLFDFIPSQFRTRLDEISKDQFFHRYPIFWQVFMWLFGGFILMDYEEQEYKLLSEKTGIPIEEIPKAFRAYELLFPIDKGWFTNFPNSNIRILKLFPVPFMGLGAFYRTLLYTTASNYDDLKLTGEYTLQDLIKWHNLGGEVLLN